MIKSEVKPLEEIKEMLAGYKKVLNTGCGGCASVCLAGGMKEVNNFLDLTEFIDKMFVDY